MTFRNLELSEQVRKFSCAGNCMNLFTHNSQDDSHLKSAFPLFRAINLGYFLEIMESDSYRKWKESCTTFHVIKYNTYPPNLITYRGVWKDTQIWLTEQLPCSCHTVDCKCEIEFIVFQIPIPTQGSWHSQGTVHNCIHTSKEGLIQANSYFSTNNLPTSFLSSPNTSFPYCWLPTQLMHMYFLLKILQGFSLRNFTQIVWFSSGNWGTQ